MSPVRNRDDKVQQLSPLRNKDDKVQQLSPLRNRDDKVQQLSPLRNRDDIIVPLCRLSLTRTSFITSAIRAGVSKWAGTRYFYPPEIVYSTGRNY